MAHVLLQPAGNKGARQHYNDTITHPVAFDKHSLLLGSKTLRNLESLYPLGEAPMWGITPGQNNVNVAKYLRATVGDLVLFAADRKIFARGTVAAMFQSRPLSVELWGVDSNGLTWEYMYALDEIRTLDLSYADFNRVVGYKTNNIIQGFTVMDEQKSSLFLDHYDFWSHKHEPDITDEQIEEALNALGGPLDRQVKSWARAEQSKARKLHLGNDIFGQCRLCGHTFGKEFLVAAHKKKRSQCTDEEKRDIAHVTMLCCLFGCDVIYEQGYVAVSPSGNVLQSPLLRDDLGAARHVSHIMQSHIQVSEKESSYFDWHLAHTFKK